MQGLPWEAQCGTFRELHCLESMRYTVFPFPLHFKLWFDLGEKTKQKRLKRESLDQNVAVSSCCYVSSEAIAHSCL